VTIVGGQDKTSIQEVPIIGGALACKVVPLSQMGVSAAILPIDAAVIVDCPTAPALNNCIVVGVGKSRWIRSDGSWKYSGLGILAYKPMVAAMKKEVTKVLIKDTAAKFVKLRLLKLELSPLTTVAQQCLPTDSKTRPIVALTLVLSRLGAPVPKVEFVAAEEKERATDERDQVGGAASSQSSSQSSSQGSTQGSTQGASQGGSKGGSQGSSQGSSQGNSQARRAALHEISDTIAFNATKKPRDASAETAAGRTTAASKATLDAAAAMMDPLTQVEVRRLSRYAGRTYKDASKAVAGYHNSLVE